MKQILTLAVILLAMVGAAIWFFDSQMVKEEVVLPAQLTVSEAKGPVSSALGGTQTSLKTGDVVPPGALVSTREDGRAVLSVREGERIEVGANTSVKVKQVDADGVSLELVSGSLRASVKQFARHTVQMGVEGGSGLVSTSNGTVKVATNDLKGSADVELEEGTATYQQGTAGEKKTLTAGRKVVLSASGDPLFDSAIPTSVLLSVDWPTQQDARQAEVPVKGSVVPGSKVVVEGQPVAVDASGKFTTNVKLKEGKQRVKISASGVGPPGLSESPEYTVDTRPPQVNTETDKLWQK